MTKLTPAQLLIVRQLAKELAVIFSKPPAASGGTSPKFYEEHVKK